MDYSELIHNFIDGEIGVPEEENLFSELADNPTLRIELKNFIELEKAAKSDIAAYIPPVESTSGIFSTLGVSQVAGVGVSVGAAVSSGFWTKYGLLLLSNLATLLLTGALGYFLFSSFNDSNSVIFQDQLNKSSLTKNVDNNRSSKIPIVSNSNSDNNSSIKSKIRFYQSRKETNKPSYIAKKGEEIKPQSKKSIENSEDISSSNSNITLNEESFASKDIENSNFNLIKQNPNSINSDDDNQNDFLRKESINYNDYPFFFNFLEKNNISLLVSGVESWSLPTATVEKSTNPFLRNSNVVLLYNLNPKLSLGLDLRQEFFFQSYKGFDKDQKEYLYEQNTNYFAIGIIGKYNIFETKYFKPFGQIYLGGNKVGQIGRAMLGMEITPGKDYGFVLGLEGSALRYYHENNYYYSKKLGAYYGVVLHF